MDWSNWSSSFLLVWNKLSSIVWATGLALEGASSVYLTRLSIKPWIYLILSSCTCCLATCSWPSRDVRYLIFHSSWLGISTVFLLWRASFSCLGQAVQRSRPAVSLKRFMFLAVVHWRSVETRLKRTLTSWQTLVFSPLQKMSVLADDCKPWRPSPCPTKLFHRT